VNPLKAALLLVLAVLLTGAIVGLCAGLVLSPAAVAWLTWFAG
jgi:hypothetical protein